MNYKKLSEGLMDINNKLVYLLMLGYTLSMNEDTNGFMIVQLDNNGKVYTDYNMVDLVDMVSELENY